MTNDLTGHRLGIVPRTGDSRTGDRGDSLYPAWGAKPHTPKDSLSKWTGSGTAELARILIVQADENCVLLMRDIIMDSFSDARVEVAHSGTMCLQCAESESYDCVLLDDDLPDMDGVTFLRRIEDLNPLLPVVIVTGERPEEVAHESMRHGAANCPICAS